LEAEKRRAERLAAFSAMASGIAHEIKNPLVAIRTFAELLPERFSEHEFREEFSRVAIKEVGRIDHLVCRLRDLATSTPTSLLRLDARELIEDTLALLRGQLLQKQITITRTYLTPHTSVSGDADQLTQLFLNIVINALEAMAPGGELKINLATHSPLDGQRFLTIEITDSGPGIPPSLLTKVFDPFVTTKPNGTGLGLAICRGIADAHRATIRAANARSGGATITIEFPPADSATSVLAVG
jgi:signal transduction histidine kinase